MVLIHEQVMENVRKDPSWVVLDSICTSLHRKVRDGFNIKSEESFKTMLSRCGGCSIKKERVFRTVLPEGDFKSRYVFVGRNPGIKEGEKGRPFFPKAPGGSLFQEYLLRLGLQREEVYITNANFCYTRGDRAPELNELFKCSLWKPIEFGFLTECRFLFLMGNHAVREFLGIDYPSILTFYGKTFWAYNPYNLNQRMMVIPVLHPGYVLRNRGIQEILNKQLDYIRVILDKDRGGG